MLVDLTALNLTTFNYIIYNEEHMKLRKENVCNIRDNVTKMYRTQYTVHFTACAAHNSFCS